MGKYIFKITTRILNGKVYTTVHMRQLHVMIPFWEIFSLLFQLSMHILPTNMLIRYMVITGHMSTHLIRRPPLPFFMIKQYTYMYCGNVVYLSDFGQIWSFFTRKINCIIKKKKLFLDIEIKEVLRLNYLILLLNYLIDSFW